MTVLLLGVVLVAGAFILSGVYNVAASRRHFAITAALLELVMRQSVKNHSRFIQSPPLDDADMVRLGAAHYQGGCVTCHRAPGGANPPIVTTMLPPPSHLQLAVRKWSPEQLFWIVKNGLKYTGMPAWIAPGRDDEVWSVVAFLIRLSDMQPEYYRSLALGDADQLHRDAREITQFGSDAALISACARCHGSEASPPQSRLVPKLAGQSADYLRLSLENYATGSRQSGIMQPVAAELDAGGLERLSAYYSNLPAQEHERSADSGSAEEIERGRHIAEAGITENGVPPCMNCHGGSGRPTYPKLAGQHGRYIAGQLGNFQKGLRSGTPQGAIMTTIARRLTARDIEDAAVFFEQLEPKDALSSGMSP
jgi:cytochrome c553